MEVLDGDDPRRIRIAKILGNFSGRLLLRCSNESFWLFWLSERFRFLGWGRTDEAKLYGCSYEPPEADGLIDSLTGPPMSVFCHQIELEEHNFAPKMKLEVLDWTDPTQFRPATVIEVLNDFFFVVEIDRLSSNKPVVKKICHRLSAGIFPTNWCRANGLRLTPPLGL